MSIAVTCPKCEKQYTVPDDFAGKSGRCSRCKNPLIIPTKPSSTDPKPLVDFVETGAASETGVNAKKHDYDKYGFPNYDSYADHTRNRDWTAKCALKNVQLDSFGTKKELKVLPNYLEGDEVVFALTSGHMHQTHTSNASDSGINTWLVVLTSERFLFLDHALLSKSVDTQSIRHDRVQAVSASQGWILGKITVDIGARTVIVDNCHKATVAPMAALANRWLAALQKKRSEGSVPRVAEPTRSLADARSPLDEIRKLAELRSIGALTDEEFTNAKAKLLASL